MIKRIRGLKDSFYKSIFIVFVFGNLCFSFFYSNAQNYWAKRVEMNYQEDEAYITKSFADSAGNLYVLNHLMAQPGYKDTLISVSKFNSTGNLLWTYLYMASFPDLYNTFLIQGKDGLPVILITFKINFTCTSILIKLDIQGNVINTKSFNFMKATFNGIIHTDDSGSLMFGEMAYNGFVSSYIVKLDASFNIEWTYRQKVDSNSISAFCALETPTNYFIGGFYSLYKYTPNGKSMILKLKKDGHPAEAKIISNEYWSQCQSIVRLNNNHLLAISHSGFNGKTIFTELDYSLNLISQRETPHWNSFFNVTSTESLIYTHLYDDTSFPAIRRAVIFDKLGNFLLGITDNNNDFYEIVPTGTSFYVKTLLDWHQTYFDIYKCDTLFNNNSCFTKSYDINLTPSALYDSLVPSPPMSPQPQDTSIDIVRALNTITVTDLCGSLGISEQSPSYFDFYPNPTSNSITIDLKKTATVTILNQLGEVVIKKNFSINEQQKVEMEVSTLAKGIYLIRVWDELEFVNKKLVVE